jgi:FkbM family methyltransferase
MLLSGPIDPRHVPDAAEVSSWLEDEAEIRAAYWHPGPGDVVMDVGCHVGSYTLPALAAGAHVYAVDPRRAYTAILAGLCPPGQRTLLTIINWALSGEGGYLPDFREALDAAPHPEHHAAADDTFVTLDELVARFGIDSLDWLKIDVEGAELGVLHGAARSLASLRPALIIEDHTDVYPFVAEMESRRHCLELLAAIGYDITTVHHPGTPGRDFWIGS